MRPVHLQQRQHVGGVTHFADVVAGSRTVGAVELEHMAPTLAAQKIDRRVVTGKAVRYGRAQAETAQRLLAEFAVRFQPVAQCAAADHLKTIAPQRVLYSTLYSRFEQDNSGLARIIRAAQPAQFGLPVGGEIEHAAVHILRRFMFDEHAHFVALRRQTQVERTQVVVFADAEIPHGACSATSATAAMRSALA